ncbi:hypothetical protein [Arcticibacterium luteifluviistationis]|uniref:Uncharacterized protein n=1 Tax=Arcticibacterium luteifluviistationis TaxID=1784714 RepID=A0A2Z4G7U4_9BACT|nr:hypothetical protein [Arcticibacterium luteifluviistationis]AWV97227.1 hypothetical protein DJ013_03190 [Arcticibacterium luteifluviistationis]
MEQRKQFILFLKKLLIFGSPMLLLVASYFVFDPFHVVRNYEAYPDNYLESYNRNRISTQVFLNNNEEQHYKSFVFGSSKSSVFYTEDWSKYIGDPNPYHFDASNEIISGIANKVDFIDQQGNDLKNALVIFDGETFNFSVDTANSIIHVQDYKWSGQNQFLYQLVFFKAFFKDMYFVKFFDKLIFKKYRAYMYGAFENKHMLYTPVNNDFIFQGYIDQLKEDSLAYYNRDLFYKRSAEELTADAGIKPYQVNYLNEMKAIFDKHNTKYKIVFGPNYDQKKVNPEDLAIVNEIFGEANVYDFTGQNELTNPLPNYYEIYHYKPTVARKVLEEIYR